ncbi:hypothetical protein ACFCP7_05435 [Paenibacillus elgii]
MLLTQHIKVHWNKKFRGAPYTTVRNEMPKAYDLPKGFFDYNPVGYPAHYVYLYQTETGLTEKINRKDTMTKYENVRIGAIEMIRQGDCYELRYRYDFHRAAPERHKYDLKTSMYVELNEFALALEPNEYGRITYNGRYSSDNWYYNLDIINVINLSEEKTSLDIFKSKEPTKFYNQIAFLR